MIASRAKRPPWSGTFKDLESSPTSLDISTARGVAACYATSGASKGARARLCDSVASGEGSEGRLRGKFRVGGSCPNLRKMPTDALRRCGQVRLDRAIVEPLQS